MQAKFQTRSFSLFLVALWGCRCSYLASHISLIITLLWIVCVHHSHTALVCFVSLSPGILSQKLCLEELIVTTRYVTSSPIVSEYISLYNDFDIILDILIQRLKQFIESLEGCYLKVIYLDFYMSLSISRSTTSYFMIIPFPTDSDMAIVSWLNDVNTLKLRLEFICLCY